MRMDSLKSLIKRDSFDQSKTFQDDSLHFEVHAMDPHAIWVMWTYNAIFCAYRICEYANERHLLKIMCKLHVTLGSIPEDSIVVYFNDAFDRRLQARMTHESECRSRKLSMDKFIIRQVLRKITV